MILKAFSIEYFKELKNIRKKNIVFFNGCFDILHTGHFKLINHAKNSKNYFAKNTIIICGINSDESVKCQNKQHPLVNDEKTRAEALELLGLEYIIIFDEETPLQLIMSLIPDVVITSSYYYNNAHNYKDLDFCNKSKIRLDYITQLADYSTTNIYNKIEQQVKEKIINEIKA